MKKNFNTLILLFCFTALFAQIQQSPILSNKPLVKVDDNGNIITSHSDTLLDGKYRMYTNGDNFFYEANYKKGALDGVSKVFYPSGKLQLELEYKEGLLHGLYKVYNENGNLLMEQSYKNGVQHGEHKEYYSSRKLLKKTVFIDGAFQNSHFYTEFDKEYLIGEKGMFYAKTKDKGHLPSFLSSYFSSLNFLIGENIGNVYLKLNIDTEGNAKDLRLLNIQKNSVLLKASKKMYKLAEKLPQFIPAKKDGLPIETTILIPLRYNRLHISTTQYRANNPNMLNSTLNNSQTHEAQKFLMRQMSPSFPRY